MITPLEFAIQLARGVVCVTVLPGLIALLGAAVGSW
jgi:hypothetical protein